MSSLSNRADLSRRTALKGLAAAVAATMARCSRPSDEIIPYVNMPEGLVAGEPMRFATTLSLSGYGRGILGISVDGRPIKIEGNSLHPFSLGATDVFAEAEVFSLYDPDRSSVIRRTGTPVASPDTSGSLPNAPIGTWDDFAAEWNRAVPSQDGSGVALVTGRIVAPTTLAQIQALKTRFPALRWYRYEPVSDDASRAGARLAFGRVVTSLSHWADADVVLALDADPLGHGPDQLRVARAYSSRRTKESSRQRIHVTEPVWTLTGAAADFRFAALPEQVREIARAIANEFGASLGEPRLSPPAHDFVQLASKDLRAAHGRALVLTGEGQGPDMHALCHWLNAQLAAPVMYLPPADPVQNDHGAEFAALADDLGARRIRALIVLDANPIYDSPTALRLAQGIAAVPFSAHLGLYHDETAQYCRWHLPLSHPLESWGDARAVDSTASIVQPLIERLYPTHTADEYLSFFATGTFGDAYSLTRATWHTNVSNSDPDWRQMLSEGVIANTAAQPVTVSAARMTALSYPSLQPAFTLVLAPDPSVWDGRFANNPWLQECAKPITRQVWGNVAQISPHDAERLGIANEETVDVTVDGHSITLPALIMEGQADGVLGATWGQGRLRAGRIGTEVGARVSRLGARPLARTLVGATIQRSNRTITFRSLQTHTRLEGRAEDLFQIAMVSELSHQPKPAPPPPSLLPTPERGEYAWAMVVDTDACIGCNACVVACQAENNVPVVGPLEVSQGRDMHWLRVDSYQRPHGYVMRRGFEPVPCMHCEFAPCEPVCPVEASVHDHEGLNVQVYNRCIGTRFCEANCPYKVRRFNWFDYSGSQAYADEGPALRAQHNPDVSARARGVMEKCNYCLQRISRARKTAEKENREIAESEMVTACQAACPTRAIHFGNLNDTNSDVSRLRHAPQHYVLLAELNTRPRTTYLKRIYNSEIG